MYDFMYTSMSAQVSIEGQVELNVSIDCSINEIYFDEFHETLDLIEAKNNYFH